MKTLALLTALAVSGCASVPCAQDLTKPLSSCSPKVHRVDPEEVITVRCINGVVLVQYKDYRGNHYHCKCLGTRTCE